MQTLLYGGVGFQSVVIDIEIVMGILAAVLHGLHFRYQAGQQTAVGHGLNLPCGYGAGHQLDQFGPHAFTGWLVNARAMALNRRECFRRDIEVEHGGHPESPQQPQRIVDKSLFCDHADLTGSDVIPTAQDID